MLDMIVLCGGSDALGHGVRVAACSFATTPSAAGDRRNAGIDSEIQFSSRIQILVTFPRPLAP
jgi:hypothetical protein